MQNFTKENAIRYRNTPSSARWEHGGRCHGSSLLQQQLSVVTDREPQCEDFPGGHQSPSCIRACSPLFFFTCPGNSFSCSLCCRYFACTHSGTWNSNRKTCPSSQLNHELAVPIKAQVTWGEMEKVEGTFPPFFYLPLWHFSYFFTKTEKEENMFSIIPLLVNILAIFICKNGHDSSRLLFLRWRRPLSHPRKLESVWTQRRLSSPSRF